MTKVTRMEKWIAPRALALLAVISILVIGGGVLVYFIREGDLNRVERLERVVQCQHSPECRHFVERAIREILRHAQRSPSGNLEISRDGGGALRVVPRDGGIAIIPAPESAPPSPKKPSAPSPSETPQGKDTPKSVKEPDRSPAPAQPPSQGTQQPEPKQESLPPGSSPPPISAAPEGLLPSLPEKVKEAIGNVVEPICTTIKELNGICEVEG